MDGTAATDRLRWEEGYRDFTLTIVCHTGRRIQSMIERLLDDTQRHRKTTLENLPSMYSGGPEFRGILEAAKARNGELASARYARFHEPCVHAYSRWDRPPTMTPPGCAAMCWR